jgi:hypothetical protein
VEEKIYRKQVFKGGLSKAGMEEGIQLRCVRARLRSMRVPTAACL